MVALNARGARHDLTPSRPRRLRATLRSKMFVGFSLLFVVSFLLFELIEHFGLPFSEFHGLIEEKRTEVFNSLNLTADLKKERLLRWLEERRDDALVLTESTLIGTQVQRLKSAIDRRRGEGITGGSLWSAVREDQVYRDLCQHLTVVQDTYKVYQNIHIADTSSMTIIAGTKESDLGKVVYSREYADGVVNEEGFLIGTWRDEEDGELELHILKTFPLEKSHRRPEEKGLGALLIMHVSPDDFLPPMLHTGGGLGETGEALLVDREVRILSTLKHPLADGTRAEPMEYRIEALPARKAAGGEEGYIETLDYRGEKVLAAYRYIPVSGDLGWGMVVKRDKAEIFKGFRRAEIYLTFIALGGIFLMLGFTHLMARNLTRPLATLGLTAQRVQQGDLGARAPVAGTDEIVELAVAFNAMVEHVQNWHRELDEQVRRRTTQLEQKTEELEKEVKAREAVQKARERLHMILEEKNEELQQIINVTSHDLRSPLVNIHGFSRELESLVQEVSALSESPEIPPAVADKLRPLVAKDIPESLTYILRGASKMDMLLKGLLKLSRLGRAALIIKPLDMEGLLSDIAISMEFQLKESDARFEVGPLPPCLGDEGQINQVFSNLLDNALKYRDPERRANIRVSGKVENGQAIYRVEDNGVGIDPNYYDKIFEMFHQLDPASAEGEGLGLTAVRRMLDRQGGRIWVNSTPGEGSVFSVSLPFADNSKGGKA